MRLRISKMIDKERLIGQFITLTKFDCESFSEVEIAEYLSSVLPCQRIVQEISIHICLQLRVLKIRKASFYPHIWTQ